MVEKLSNNIMKSVKIKLDDQKENSLEAYFFLDRPTSCV